MSNKQKRILTFFVLVILPVGLALIGYLDPNPSHPVGGGGVCAVMGDVVLYNSDCGYEMMN